MIQIKPARAICISICALLLLAACGSSSTQPAATLPPTATSPDVIVTFDGKRHACLVALPSEAHGSEVACQDLVTFIRDELRRPSGSSYDVRVIYDFDPGERARVELALKEGGYRFIGAAQPH